ncbi:MAG: cell surface protein [Verrucomicrobiota bacterium]
MNRNCFTHFPMVILAVGTFVVGQPLVAEEMPPPPASGTPLSPTALAATRDGRRLFIACATGRCLLRFDTGTGSVCQKIDLPAPASGLALSPDESQLYVTCAAAVSSICVVDTATSNISGQLVAGHTAMAPVPNAAGTVLYVCNRFNNSVVAIDLIHRCQLWTALVTREPVAAALTPDGKQLLIVNHLHEGRADGGVIGVVVNVLDAETGCLIKKIQLPRGSSLARGVAISADGRFAAVTHLIARYYLTTTDVEFGRINANALSILDLNRLEWIRVVYLDYAGRGAANPWSVMWTSDGRALVVTHAGTHEISVVEAPLAPQKSLRVRARLGLPGNGPRAMAIVGPLVYVANYFSDTLAMIDLSQPDLEPVEFGLTAPQPPTPERQGEMWFNDATLCYQGWQSCASCHDTDARVDALNWDLLNDGQGNPKNAKSLLWSHRTPPVMALGVRASAEIAVRAGLKYILFADPAEEVPAAIDAYVRSLEPQPSPRLQNGGLSAAAERGRALFQSEAIGCARCHPGPLFTDLKSHRVGSGGYHDQGDERFDTPALVELWRTAPYLHDGSAATLRDVLTSRNAQNLHGKTTQLSAAEIDDLIAYLGSL